MAVQDGAGVEDHADDEVAILLVVGRGSAHRSDQQKHQCRARKRDRPVSSHRTRDRHQESTGMRPRAFASCWMRFRMTVRRA